MSGVEMAKGGETVRGADDGKMLHTALIDFARTSPDPEARICATSISRKTFLAGRRLRSPSEDCLQTGRLSSKIDLLMLLRLRRVRVTARYTMRQTFMYMSPRLPRHLVVPRPHGRLRLQTLCLRSQIRRRTQRRLESPVGIEAQLWQCLERFQHRRPLLHLHLPCRPSDPRALLRHHHHHLAKTRPIAAPCSARLPAENSSCAK
jgi:hypothetical protein